MSQQVGFAPEASAELEDAIRWYEQRHAGLGLAFLAAVDVAVGSVARTPRAGARLGGLSEDLERRRVPESRFPYHRVYLVKARLFPYQVWAAYKHAPSDDWKRALGRTLDHTVANIPPLDGTLVVIDTSSSMTAPVSGRSKLSRVEVAAVMAMASAKRSTDVDVVLFGDRNRRLRELAGISVLGGVAKVVDLVGSVGHSTYGHTAIARHFDPKRHERVVIFTNDQQHDSGRVRLDRVPLIYMFDLAGYRPSALPAGPRGRHTLGGFTDLHSHEGAGGRPQRRLAVHGVSLPGTRRLPRSKVMAGVEAATPAARGRRG